MSSPRCKDAQIDAVAATSGEHWTLQHLKWVYDSQLRSPQLIVVSNRQPFSHNRLSDGRVEVAATVGGMVNAIGPLVCSCSGTWIAHGSGSADRDVVDAHDRISLPPERPSFTLRRLWLSPQDEAGYYDGFSNGALWPLCHRTHVQPQFRTDDWARYQSVNDKFADAVLDEARSATPLVLIQDYHLSLLPALVRARLPHSTIVIFWHIPWLDPGRMRLCPWLSVLLEHLLAADIVGFNTPDFCAAFRACVAQHGCGVLNGPNIEISQARHVAHVAAYPESIEWSPEWEASIPSMQQSRAEVRARFGIGPDVFLALGVDRWDFTKGIIERMQALEVFLGMHPEWLGKITLVQIAAPSRTRLPAYKDLQERTVSEVHRINGEFATVSWKPIVLVAEQIPRERVYTLYRGAECCIVNSLDDGMNLVAKEFVAAREDEDGVLILSRAAGAAAELVDAVLVDPRSVVDIAEAIERSVQMPRDERQQRMQAMRTAVRQNDAYRWAGRIFMDTASIGMNGGGTARDGARHAPTQ